MDNVEERNNCNITLTPKSLIQELQIHVEHLIISGYRHRAIGEDQELASES
jgi:hypothetical protein